MKVIQDLKIIAKVPLNKDHFILECSSAEGLPEVLPGQFAEILVEHNQKVFLRRPLSVHDVDFEKQSIQFLIKIVGEGTRELNRLETGDTLNVVFPLGNGFTLPQAGKVLLVGGGCGSAPLLFLARKLQEKGISVTTLLGARTREDLMEVSVFEQFGQVALSTDDGSAGEKGFITRHSLWEQANQFDVIYCCGPEVMMKVVAGLAKEKGVTCYVSLENTMACGIGACLCCVTETVRGNECVCTQGPVFNINELKWQI